jgi:hypothetical protein
MDTSNKEIVFCTPLSVYFKICLFTIFIVSLIDFYWAIRLAEILPEEEINPLGQLLIKADGNRISLFMTLKVLGTFAVIWSLILIYQIKRRFAYVCSIILVLFQLFLLYYFIT